jgi:acetolactate synthase I/II/III large subunit
MKLSVGRLIVQFLREAGVRYVFGLSGHSIFPLTDALYSEPRLRFVPVMHELSAAYMAAAYAKGTRNLGVCIASAGAGVTNLLTGVAYAYKESIPVVVLAADVSRNRAGKGVSSWHEIPQREMFAPITKLSVTLESADQAPEALQKAFNKATSGRKGPVYIGIPRNLQNEEIDVPESLWMPAPVTAKEPDQFILDKAAKEIEEAAAPIIVAGGGVYWARGEEELRELAELLSIPFGSTPSHKGLISEDHPLSVGVLGFGAFPFANAFCVEADLILAVGVTFSEGFTLGYGNKVISSGAKIIQIDIDPREIGKIYPVHLPILGDAKAVLRAIIERLRHAAVKKKNLSRLDNLSRQKNTWRDKLFGHDFFAGNPINQWHVYRALREAIGTDAVVVGAGGTAELIRRFIASSYVYHSGDMRAIGFGFSTAIGLSLAFPARPVVCVTGDGSFMLESQELATAAALKLPVSVIVIRNDAYGNMKRDQIRHYGGRVIGTDLHLPDLCTLATAYGIATERVTQPSALLPAIKKSVASGGPSLLDVVCPIEGL